AAIPPISPVGSTIGDIFLTPETHTTLAALAGLDADHGFVYKLHRGNKKQKAPSLAGLCKNSLLNRSLYRYHIDIGMLSGPFHLKAHLPIDLCKQGMILTASYINACVETRSPLPNQYIACNDTLSAEALDAQAFRLRVSSISCTAPCF